MRTVKSSLLVLEGLFTSGPNGVTRVYLASDDVRKLIGQASSVRVSVLTTNRTTNAQLVIKLYDTAGPVRPTDLDSAYAAFFTSAALTSNFPAPINIAGPFCDNVDLALEVSASTGTNVETWQGSITMTLFFN